MECLSHQNFTMCSVETFETIFNLIKFNTENELPIMLAAEKWAKNKIGTLSDSDRFRIRQMLETINPKIRSLILPEADGFDNCNAAPPCNSNYQKDVGSYLQGGDESFQAEEPSPMANPVVVEKTMTADFLQTPIPANIKYSKFLFVSYGVDKKSVHKSKIKRISTYLKN
jgi:hypothetical protein